MARTTQPSLQEWQMQARVFDWANDNIGRWPDLELLYASANGELRPYKRNAKGQRYSAAGNRLKRSGVKSGVPDVNLPVRSRAFIGLWIEMKRKPNKATLDQFQWMCALTERGHYCDICWNEDEATDVLVNYLSGQFIALPAWYQAWETHREVPVWVDSPLAKRATAPKKTSTRQKKGGKTAIVPVPVPEKTPHLTKLAEMFPNASLDFIKLNT